MKTTNPIEDFDARMRLAKDPSQRAQICQEICAAVRDGKLITPPPPVVTRAKTIAEFDALMRAAREPISRAAIAAEFLSAVYSRKIVNP